METPERVIAEIAQNNGIEYAMLRSFIQVETGGLGFDKATGKLIIQFEPSWFRKKAPYAPSGAWSLNGVERQAAEWRAFNEAFRINPDAAMQATSIGLPQIMGFHYRTLGYKTVGYMWDDFKRGEYQQLLALVRFIKATPELFKAMKAHDFTKIASIYNGAYFKQKAIEWNREPYDISLQKAYARWKKK